MQFRTGRSRPATTVALTAARGSIPYSTLAAMIRPLLACAALTASPALAQLETPVFRALGAPNPVVDTDFVLPAPGGGARGCLPTAPGVIGMGTARLLRVDESGEVLWQRSELIPTRTGRLDSVLWTPGGSILLNKQNDSNVLIGGELRSIDANGNLEWGTWPTSVAGGLFLGRVGGFSPEGDIYLVGYSLNDPRLSVMLLDAGTGAEMWRLDLPVLSQLLVTGSLRASSAGGDLFVAFDNGASHSALRVDPSGNVVYQRTDLGLPYFQNDVRLARATPDGEFVVGVPVRLAPGASPTFTSRLRWIEPASAPSEIAGAARTGDGDVVVGYRRNGGLLRRLDADGAIVWQRTGPAGVGVTEQVALGPEGSVTALFKTSAGRRVARYGANGDMLGTLQLRSTAPVAPSVVSDARLSDADARGNTWVAYVSGQSSGTSTVALGTAIAKIVLDEASETTVCTPSSPNSTGATGRLEAIGSARAAADNLTLVARDLPTGQPVLFLSAAQAGFAPNPGGSSGDLCLGALLGRYAQQVIVSDLTGGATLQLDLPRTPQGAGTVPVLAGETRYWQAWHRESGGGSHLTSAISVRFQ